MAKDFDRELLAQLASAGRVQWHLHALERLFERGITRQEVLDTLSAGELVEVYSQGRPYPSGLLLQTHVQPLHVVAAVDPVARVCHVITAYRPDLEHFEPGFRIRRKDR